MATLVPTATPVSTGGCLCVLRGFTKVDLAHPGVTFQSRSSGMELRMLLLCPCLSPTLFPRVLSPCQGPFLDPVHWEEERKDCGQELLLQLGVSIDAW